MQATTGIGSGTIDVVWQKPRIPHHGLPCSGTYEVPADCPTPHGDSSPSSDGGDAIVEYEVEYNEQPNFGGSDSGRKLFTSTSCTLTNLIQGRTYYIRVLARNTIGSGPFCERKGSNYCNGELVSAVSAI